MFKNLSAGTKQVISALIPLTVVAVLFAAVGNFGWSKISEVRANLAAAQKERTLLTQKLEALKSVSSSVGESATTTVDVLPVNNPSLVVISQIKLLASENSVLISGIKSGSETADKNGLLRSDINFDVSAPQAGVVAFIKAIENIAPVVAVYKIKLSENKGLENSTISVRTFWAPLPTKLPSLTTQITELTPAEKQLLTEIENLRKPVFAQITPSEGTGRLDPFSP